MKVGVDARLLSRPLTGIGRYTLEMCLAILNVEGVSLYLYSPAPLRTELERGFEAAVTRYQSFENGFLRQVWGESYLPIWAKKDGVDVFWGPAHRLPHWLPGGMARVVTIHDLVWKCASDTMRPLSRMLEHYQMPFAVRTADTVIAVSQSTADAVIEEFGIGYDKLSIVPPGARLHTKVLPLETLEQFGIKPPYFLFVGTLEPRKNLIRLLTAYSRLSESLKSHAMLVIAGSEGWGGINIDKTVADLGLENHVRLLGFVEESTLSALYANALFLAMPSLYEGFGLPLVEAMVHGTPVLTSNNSSMPEVAGDAGLLVDALDISSIENGLSKLIGDEVIRNELALNSIKNASRFNWDQSARKLIAVFEKVIGNRH
jgi:glycosyltransferase involved in cell wall biosynthesis